MKPEHLADIATRIRDNGGAVSPFEARERERLIASHAANRERFIEKIRSAAYEWQKPAPRRGQAK